MHFPYHTHTYTHTREFATVCYLPSSTPVSAISAYLNQANLPAELGMVLHRWLERVLESGIQAHIPPQFLSSKVTIRPQKQSYD